MAGRAQSTEHSWATSYYWGFNERATSCLWASELTSMKLLSRIRKKILITTERNQAAHTRRADPSHPNTSVCQTRITTSHPWIKVLSGTNGFSLNQFKLFYTQSISFVALRYCIWTRSHVFKIQNHFTHIDDCCQHLASFTQTSW